jgi:hypothetical protein
MDINDLRDKWTAFLSASISAKYGGSEKEKEHMLEKLQEFDKIWEAYKNEQSPTGKDNLGESEETRASV